MSIHARTTDFAIGAERPSRSTRWIAFAGAAITLALCLAVLAYPFIGARVVEAPSETVMMSGP